jgi:hypothetical protein
LFMVAGRAGDDTGIASLSWNYRGEDPQELELSPGNPFWSVMVDFVGQRQMDVEFNLEDLAGNVTRIQLRRPLDLEADLPSLQIQSPAVDRPADPRLSGWILDDDAPGGIIYRLDRGEEQRVETAGAFSLELGDLPAGEHRISVRAFDIHGLEGEEQELDFFIPPADPEILIERISGTVNIDYSRGDVFRSDESRVLEGRVIFDGGAGLLNWQLPGGEPRAARLSRGEAPGEYLFAIDLGEQTPFGYLPVVFSADDDLGSSSTHTAYLWSENLSRNTNDFGFYLPEGDVLYLSEGESFDLRYLGHPLDELIIDGDSEELVVSEEGGLVSIRGQAPGSYKRFTLRGISDRGTEFSVDLPRLVVDFAPPEIELSGDPSGEYSRRPRIAGLVRDDGGQPQVEIRVGDGAFTPVSLNRVDDGYTFDLPVDLSAGAGDPLLVQVLARDASGKAASAYRTFLPAPAADETPRAAIRGFAGFAQDAVLTSDLSDGRLYVSAAFAGIDSVNSVRYLLDGEEGGRLSGFPVAEALIRLPEAGSRSIEIIAEYGDGEMLRSSFRFDIAPGQLKITPRSFTQGMDLLRREDGFIDFPVPEDYPLDRALLRMDGGEELELRLNRGESGGLLQIPIEDLSYGNHRFELTTIDDFGRSSAFSGFFFLLADGSGRRVDDEEGLYALGLEDGIYAFRFNGRPLSEIGFSDTSDGSDSSLAVDSGGFTVDRDGEIITIRSVGGVFVSQGRISARTVDGELFSFGPADFSGDFSAPELEIRNPGLSSYFADLLPIELQAVDEDEYLLEYRFGSESWSALEPGLSDGPADDPADPASDSQEPDGLIRASLPLGSQAEGPLYLEIRATDRSGNQSRSELLLVRDSGNPVIGTLLPQADEPVNGEISLIFRIRDEWSPDLEGGFLLGDSDVPVVVENGFATFIADFSPYEALPEVFALSTLDQAGNIGLITPQVVFDPESDKPLVQLQLPQSNALITDDAVFSGTVFDDDGVSRITYRLDQEEPVEIEGGSSFEIIIPFAELSDNEHLMEITAYDLRGVSSDPVILPFRVSRESPEAELISPVLGSTNRAEILLEGQASDENGISAVYVSLDNGLTYALTDLIEISDEQEDGTQSGEADSEDGLSLPSPQASRQWRYLLDSQVLVDGNYMVLIKAVDGYGVEAVNSSLISVDNTPPLMELSLPGDGQEYTDVLPIQLRLSDELAVRRVRYEITRISDTDEQASAVMADSLIPRRVLLEELDLSALVPGLYNLTIYSYDDADNESIASRDFFRRSSDERSVPKLLYPLSGSEVNGPFYLEGRVEGSLIPGTVTIFRNGAAFAVAETDEQGYFRHLVEADVLSNGTQRFSANIEDEGGRISSRQIEIVYREIGPWLLIDSIRTGQFASQRPWISGRLGYALPATAEGEERTRGELREFEVELLEYSLDNGRTFTDFRANEEWKFRLETQDISDGQLSILVRASFANGESAQDLIHVFVDDTSPQVTVLTPEENLAMNGSLTVSGTAFDANGLSDISVMLRPRSKNSYEVPQFIQGLYVDAHVLGATTWELGIGLTFFDNNVKLQALYGQAPAGRFNGQVLGFKMLANVFALPYGFLFGPDWDFLSSSIAVGAAFEYFTMEESSVPDQPGLVLGAVVLQLELLKIELENAGMFNAYAAYVENQLWFISSDVEGGLAYRLAFGLRINVF